MENLILKSLVEAVKILQIARGDKDVCNITPASQKLLHAEIALDKQIAEMI